MHIAQSSDNHLKIDLEGLTWWDEYPNYKCSLCLEQIKEDECPIMFFDTQRRK